MGFRGGSQIPQGGGSQRILVFKYPSRDRVKKLHTILKDLNSPRNRNSIFKKFYKEFQVVLGLEVSSSPRITLYVRTRTSNLIKEIFRRTFFYFLTCNQINMLFPCCAERKCLKNELSSKVDIIKLFP